jgi:hypothetical protein
LLALLALPVLSLLKQACRSGLTKQAIRAVKPVRRVPVP